jgi:prepilin-type N-terminal cleavage/methylation domain-containing protein
MKACGGKPSAMRRAGNGRASEGFTLIELLAVLIIISILAYFLVTNIRGARESVEVGTTRNLLKQIGTALHEFDNQTGDFPPSQFPSEWGSPPNATNVGAECVYLSLCAEKGIGFGTLDKPEQLVNTDGDSLTKRMKGFERSDLFELCDAWDNPIAYFHHRDYDREDLYVTNDPQTGEPIQSTARAHRNEKTGRWLEPQAFQLISAGPDGQFGNADDIVDASKP